MTPRDFRIAASALSVGSIGPAPVWHLIGRAPRGEDAAKARRSLAPIEAKPSAAARVGWLATLAAWVAAALESLSRTLTTPA